MGIYLHTHMPVTQSVDITEHLDQLRLDDIYRIEKKVNGGCLATKQLE